MGGGPCAAGAVSRPKGPSCRRLCDRPALVRILRSVIRFIGFVEIEKVLLHRNRVRRAGIIRRAATRNRRLFSYSVRRRCFTLAGTAVALIPSQHGPSFRA